MNATPEQIAAAQGRVAALQVKIENQENQIRAMVEEVIATRAPDFFSSGDGKARLRSLAEEFAGPIVRAALGP